MNFSKKILTLLPDHVQERMLHKVIASGKWRRIPTFHMLFTSFEIMGADHTDLMEVFSNSHDMGESLFRNCRIVAEKRLAAILTPQKAQGSNPSDLSELQKVLMLYFLADWVSTTSTMFTANYPDLLRVAALMEPICVPPVEKIALSWKSGLIHMRLRIPAVLTPKTALPIIALFQGNDTTKETLYFLEEWLLHANFAVLNIDQPGWGESLLGGLHFDSYEEMPALARVIIDMITARKNLDASRICVCGFSGGGSYAAMMAGSDPRFKCFVSYGGGIYNLEKAIRGLPSTQKKQVMKHWGCTRDQLDIMLKTMDFNQILPKIQADTLIIHGEKDTLLPIQDARKAFQLISGPKEFHSVPGGDHMCSDTMRSTEIPFMINWLRIHL